MYIKGGIHFFGFFLSTLYIEEHYIFLKKMLKVVFILPLFSICVRSIIFYWEKMMHHFSCFNLQLKH